MAAGVEGASARDKNAALPERRGAVFFDRDGVINVDRGYVHRAEDLEWIEGAVAAVKAVNDRGLFAFLVTNQSGVARGYFGETEVKALHAHIQARLREAGAHFDDIRYCPHHPEGAVTAFARDCNWRKPGPGMILDLARAWPVDLAASLLVGDKPSDLEAARAAGVRGALFEGGDLKAFVVAALVEGEAA